MINPKRPCIYFVALCMIAPQLMYAKFSVQQKVNSILKRSAHEATVQKEIPVKDRTIYIKNTNGCITVKSDWDSQTLLLTATKKASKPEYLDLVTIDDSKSDKKCIKIETTCRRDNKKAATVSVDYELLVPQNVRLELVSDNGTIKVKEMNGQIVAKTCNSGNIEIDNAQNAVFAQIEKNGSIIINQAQNNVKAFAHHGNITIHNAKKGIIAQTNKGTVDVECLQVPTTSKVTLNSRSGNITLRLPESTNAELQAHTEKGTVTCAHYVTVKPLTTQLNSNAWTRFKKEVEGTLGSGEASITVHTGNGNIKILDVTV